mmetsp:Transcript_19970/g.33440  ORF Transcript_19970/g.33440 Transcript_19970/m.33440 type:complete len:441 (-) Transcript_19970:986-2308(-)
MPTTSKKQYQSTHMYATGTITLPINFGVYYNLLINYFVHYFHTSRSSEISSNSNTSGSNIQCTYVIRIDDGASVIAVEVQVALVHFDGSINLPHEPQAGEEADGSGEHKEGDGDHGHVREVEHGGHQTLDVQLGHEVPQRVEEQVRSRGPSGQIGPPPPLVVLVAQLEVAHHDRNLRTRRNQDDQHDKQKSKHEVQLMQPHGGHDEEQLDAHGSKGQNAAQRNAEGWVRVPHLIRNMPGDLVGAHRYLDGFLAEAEVRAHKHQWRRDAEPEQHQRQQSGDRSSGGGPVRRDEGIDGEKDHTNYSREKHRRHQCVALPFLAVEQLVHARGGVACEGAHEDEEHQQRGQQTAAVVRGSQAQQRAHHGRESHRQDLHTRACEDGEQHGRERGRSEHIPVHQLPARLLLRLLQGLHLIVRRDVLVQRAQHDHGHHARQEQHDHE